MSVFYVTDKESAKCARYTGLFQFASISIGMQYQNLQFGQPYTAPYEKKLIETINVFFMKSHKI